MHNDLIARLEAATGRALYDFHGLPSWARYGGEYYDGGWAPDCNGKQDFDPGFMRFCCRVYPDGDYVCSLYLGDDFPIEETDILHAGSVSKARDAVEAWCAERAAHWRDIAIAALKARGA